MINIQNHKNTLISIFLAVILSTSLSAQDGATLFKPCTVCHSIGGGRLVGPDLKGITQRRSNEWLIKFIQSSNKLINSGDAEAKAVFQEYNNSPMPDNALTADQINQILLYIDGEKARANFAVDPEKAALQQKIDSILKANAEQDILKGKALFNGSLRFENGGASCASCHNATYNKISKGGTLAKDLTKAYSRLGGFAGLKGIIAIPPYPSMAQAYKLHAITEVESAYLQLFLKSADAQNPAEPLVSKTWFIHASLTAGFLIVLAIALLWIRRKRRSVNDAIIKRQKRHAE